MKSTSQATITTTVKGKSVVVVSTGVVHPLSHPDMHIEDVGEKRPSRATTPEAGTNQPETRLPAKGQLLQMLASFQK